MPSQPVRVSVDVSTKYPTQAATRKAAPRGTGPHAGGDEATAQGDPPERAGPNGGTGPFYIFTAFVFSYGIGTLNVSRDFLLFAALTASIVSFISIPLFGPISDRIGRKKMYMLGAATVGVFGFIYFGILNTGSLVLIFLAIVISLIRMT